MFATPTELSVDEAIKRIVKRLRCSRAEARAMLSRWFKAVDRVPWGALLKKIEAEQHRRRLVELMRQGGDECGDERDDVSLSL